MQIAIGIANSLGLAVTLPYTAEASEQVNSTLNSRSAGVSDLNVVLKYRFLDTDGLKLTFRPLIILPTGNTAEGLSDGKFGYSAALLATKEFSEGKFLLHANTGYARHNYEDDAVRDSSRHDIFTFSIACEAEIAEGLRLGADIGLATNADKASDTPPVYAIIGVKYEFIKALEGYVGLKAGLTKPEDDLAALFGITLKY